MTRRRRGDKTVPRRTQARMAALQALCAFEAVGDEFEQQLSEFLHDPVTWVDLGFERPPGDDLLAFARELALRAWRQRELLDRELARTAVHWSVARMTPVDRNILRLGLHELLEYPETPPQVVINEAVELARRFGDADSSAFVNGVLDAARKRIMSETTTPGGQTPPADPQTEGKNGAL